MRKVRSFVGVALLAACSHGYAVNWVPLASSNHSTIYVDKQSVKMIDGKPRAWVLFDLKNKVSIGGRDYRSAVFLTEYDCNESRRRFLSIRYTTEQMSVGESYVEEGKDKPTDWAYVGPGSNADVPRHYLCDGPR